MIRKTLLPAVAGTVATVLVACGSGPGGDKDGKTIVVGTTDTFTLSEEAPAPFDPAAAYEATSWNILRNTFQTLLRLPRSGTEPVPDAARRCDFTDRANEQYRCTLRDDLAFSNGHQLTAEDVVFSIRRSQRIAHPNGPVSLLSNIDTVEATSSREVVFHLKEPDATFPYKLATPAAAVVDRQEYAADKLKRGFEIVGSGPYMLESFEPKEGRALFRPNPEYGGDVEVDNDGIELRFFDGSTEVEKALRAGDIHVMMNRSMSPRQIERLDRDNDDDIDIVEAAGQETRYLFFDLAAEPGGDAAIRRAVAQVIDRQALVRDVYERTAEPLYSVIPAGLLGHRNSFYNRYGEPDVDAARDTLREAGVETPVTFQLAYTPDHGEVTHEEFRNLRDQLNESGLFEVKLKSVPRSNFYARIAKGRYPVFGLGWVPDFPDPESFLTPFFGEDNFVHNSYQDDELDQRFAKIRRTAQRSSTVGDFRRVQDIVARDVPLVPVWQGKDYLAVRDGVTGGEWALNVAGTFQMWELGRGASA